MVKIEDEEAFHAAFKDIRSDSVETNWLLAVHVENSPELIKLNGSGIGGIDELASHLDPSTVQYGLLRVTQKIDLSTTVKFAFIYFIGEQVPALQRGKIGTAHSEVANLFSPYHVDFEITSPSEISAEVIEHKIAENSGKVDKVREVSHDHERGFTASSTKQQGAKKSAFGFQGETGTSETVDSDSSVPDAVADVRNDKTETNWILSGYQDNDVKKPVAVLATGNGGVEEIKPHLTPDLIAYALIRVVDVIEGIKTVKFVFFTFIGPDVPIMKKAKVSTNKGAIAPLFAPSHVTLEVTSPEELSDDILLTAVQEASGSKSKVK